MIGPVIGLALFALTFVYGGILTWIDLRERLFVPKGCMRPVMGPPVVPLLMLFEIVGIALLVVWPR